MRIFEGRITNQGIGFEKFTQQQLNGPVVLIDTFFLRSGAQVTVFGSTKDLYQFDEVNDTVAFITPIENTGTVDVSGADPAIVSSASGPTAFDTNGVKVGDEISFGASDETDPDATWYEIASVDSDTQLTLTTAVTGAPLSGVAYTARKLFSGDEKDYFRTETFPKASPGDEDLWFATNGVDDIVVWDGSAAQVTITSFDFRCREIIRFKNMMIYANLTLDTGEVRPASFRNSAIGAPENVTTAEASEFIAIESVTDIVGLHTIGDVLVIYTQRDVAQAQFVGTPLVFVFRSAVQGIGPLNGRLVADFGDFHEFIGPDAKYRFDGVSLHEEDFQVWREVIRTRAPDRTELGLGHFDEERGVIMWAIPRTTDPNTQQNDVAMLQHYLEDIGSDTPTPYTQQHFPATATGFFERLDTLTFADITTTWEEQNYRWNDQFFQAAFPLNLFGDASGNIYTVGTIDSFDGDAITSFARFPRRPTINERLRGTISRIYPFAEARPGADYDLDVRLRGTDQVAGTMSTLTTLAYDLTHAGNRFVSPRQAARFFEVEFRTSGVGHVWTLAGWDFDVVPGGGR